ncbi:MAG TPA: FtsQ-type POTRA domain-containing protein [Acidobacteriota bacterium]|jgi:cell division protein FtsQ|nr:FtsQ-type POTRA domain-containing protein [Acidobacteriota bacterium]
MPVKKIQTQNEKVIDYQYIRNLKNREVRKSRFKRTFSQRAVRIILILVLSLEGGYLGFHGLQALKSSSWFFLNHIEVTGTEKTKVEEIKKYIHEGQRNALFADLTSIKLGLENHPWIETAVIWRELPGTIRVHIRERHPIALVLAGNLYLVDHDGKVIDTFDQDPKYASLPVLTGIHEVSNETEIRHALQFVTALSKDPSVLNQVSEINYYDGQNSIIYLKGFSFGLLVSKDGILPMIKKFIDYSELIKKNFTDVKVVDLRYQSQIILKHSYREQL